MLSYIDKGDGTPIVFIHGLGQRKEAWNPQLELSEKYRLIIPDLRGHGETTEDKNISIENFAKDIIELLEELSISTAYICGLSLGGIIAQELFKQRPKMVRGLILANTTSYISSLLAHEVIVTAVKHYRDDDFIGEIVERGLYDKSFTEEAENSFLIRESYISSMSSSMDINYFPVLLQANIPILLMGSMYDKVTPLPNLLSMKMCNVFAQTKILYSGHLSNIECREEFNKAINRFVKE